MLDHVTVRKFLDYDPDTGVFTWRAKPSNRANRIRVGKPAGHVWRGPRGDAYNKLAIRGQAYRAARLAVFWMTGAWPSSEVDHKDGDTLNDRWSNLRLASRLENSRNRAAQINNKLGVKGVYFDKTLRRYRAQIKGDGRRWHLGLFDSTEEAHVAYCAAAKKYHGEFARILSPQAV